MGCRVTGRPDSDDPRRGLRRIPGSTNFWVAFSTLLAAIFVALQTWYARVAFVDASETRLLQTRLDTCFENFDAATRLDQELRELAREGAHPEVWPPMIMADTETELRRYQERVPPLLASLENGLMKASIFGALDAPRSYLSQHIAGLGERLVTLDPAAAARPEAQAQVRSLFATLSEFIGAQYLVFEGCKTVAQRN